MWCGYVFWGDKTDGDVRILKILNLDPFDDVANPQIYPQIAKISLRLVPFKKYVRSINSVSTRPLPPLVRFSYNEKC